MKVVSIFSGAGGMDLGFKQAGFEIIFANDISVKACETYEKNLDLKPVRKDVRKIKQLPKADVLIACNPCQGFSIIGKRDENDERNLLYREIFRCLRLVNPKFFVVENVRGLASLYKGKFLTRMLRGFSRCGYKVRWQILDAKDYGVPQHRERIFIVGIRKDLEVTYEFPKKSHGPGLKPHVTLRKKIGKMPKPKKEEYFHDDYWSFFYMSRNRRADWDRYSYTIQTMASHIPLHPSSPPMKRVGKDKFKFTARRKKYRRLSVRECARIQTFPDDFEFIGATKSQYKLVGNAVPPLLARKLAESIKRSAARTSRMAVKRWSGVRPTIQKRQEINTKVNWPSYEYLDTKARWRGNARHI
jgi:DNA (cytosine-5)-methyltransferase 1